MLASKPKIEPHLLADAESLRVHEIYLSLQGESSHAGLLCAFVRLTGCHLRCTYCDSRFAFYGGSRMSLDEVITQVEQLGAPRVEITGGEPLLQPAVYPLMERLLQRGHLVMLETSGAIDVRLVPPEVRKIVDLKTPSSGECERNDLRVLGSMNAFDELKFVIGSREDYLWSRSLLKAEQLSSKPFGLLFSTVFGKLEPRTLAEWIIEDRLPVRFQIQQHKYVWEPDARGV